MKERPILFSGEMVRAILDGRKTQTRRAVKPQPVLKPGFELNMPGPMSTRAIPVCWDCKKHGVENDSPYPQIWLTDEAIPCPYQPGDRLWVKETYCAHWGPEPIGEGARLSHRQIAGARVKQTTGSFVTSTKAEPIRVWYAASGEKPYPHSRWHSSIHCPRWASRLTLGVTDVRVERLQDISAADALAEGIDLPVPPGAMGDPAFPDGFKKWSETKQDEWVKATARSIFFARCADADNHVSAYQKLWDSINGTGSWEANPWVWVVSFKRTVAELPG
jgi:hypothetical protein